MSHSIPKVRLILAVVSVVALLLFAGCLSADLTTGMDEQPEVSVEPTDCPTPDDCELEVTVDDMGNADAVVLFEGRDSYKTLAEGDSVTTTSRSPVIFEQRGKLLKALDQYTVAPEDLADYETEPTPQAGVDIQEDSDANEVRVAIISMSETDRLYVYGCGTETTDDPDAELTNVGDVEIVDQCSPGDTVTVTAPTEDTETVIEAYDFQG